MSFDWREYLVLSRYLASGQSPVSSECADRCAVSRAYYSAFCRARENAVARLRYQPFNDGRDHGAVRKRYQEYGMPDVHDALEELYEWRCMCDYDNTVANHAQLAHNAVAEAAKVLQRL